jgi:hypothetical protein
MAQGGPKKEHQMSEQVLVQVGNATKLHRAIRLEVRGRLITVVNCGTKSLRGKSVLEVADTSRFVFCEKCEERELVKA